MNERIRELAEQAKFMAEEDINRQISYNAELKAFAEKFAELIVLECAKLNKKQSYELMGVIIDVEQGGGFDDVCLNTVKRVARCLNTDLKNHFGVE